MPEDPRQGVADYLGLMAMMGVRFVAVGERTQAPQPLAAPPRAAAPATTGDETLESIRADLGECRRCKLCEGRRTIVFCDGNPAAELAFVGEGPGADEDAQGLPFVGAAGQLLNKIIGAMGMKREQVWIGNIVKCRPPGNRTPEEDEIKECLPFLVRQIEVVRPRIVVALGATAAQTLTDSREPMGRMRGKIRDLRIGRHDTKFMATYHPAYLLRSPDKKKDVWEDVQKVMAFLKE